MINLRRNPFFVADARRIGVTWEDLQSRSWKRLSRGQYVSTNLVHDARLTLRAVARRMPPGHAFSGPTAAWIWGLDLEPCNPVEVTIGRDVPVRARAGVRLRRASLPESDVVTIRDFRTTCALRTVTDLGSRPSFLESVVALDMALRAGLVGRSQLIDYVDTHAGAKGIKRLRRAVAHADARSESPMETRLRIALVTGRLPSPLVQVELHDSSGRFLGRADLYYPDRRLLIEYDGENHRDRLVSDMRRQNALVNAGYQLLRFTASDLAVPGSVAAQVREARARLRKLPWEIAG
ncbi:MAG TPA: DUF559 domain-containing protein [Candidatus Dormibacteraeota bacterium]|nr:DUF559 domain-containing protein [Candidatus Dormibacteraeota bacterium]